MAEQRAAGQFPWPSVLLVIALFIVLFAVLVLSGLYADVDLPGLVNLPALNAGGDDQSEVLPPQQEPTSTPQPTNTPTQTQVPSTTPTPTQTPTSTPTPRPTPVLEWTEDDLSWFYQAWLYQVMLNERFEEKLGCRDADNLIPWGYEDPLIRKYYADFDYCAGDGIVTIPIRYSKWLHSEDAGWWFTALSLRELPAWDACRIFANHYQEFGWENEYQGEARVEAMQNRIPMLLIDRLGNPRQNPYCPNFDISSQWCSNEATRGRCNNEESE